MKVTCFTSFSFSYLNRARVLAKSVKRKHPDWNFVALIADREPVGFTFQPSQEPFDQVIMANALGIEDYESWLFKHDVIETCTAIKGPALSHLLDTADIVLYLDPDTAVFGDLSPIVELLKRHSVVFTPHQLAPDTERSAIIDNEICSLRTGIYNLGFVAVSSEAEGRRFADWWAARLLEFCYDNIPEGLFVDQRWCDLAPAFFEGVTILRDPGYNVASWNLSQRKIEIDLAGDVLVNGSPLRFWHFTKLGPVGDTMTQRYARDNIEVYELWRWYKEQVDRETDPNIQSRWWAFNYFENGQSISKDDRLLYRQRVDLQKAFRDPFACGPYSYWDWLVGEGHRVAL